MRKLENEGNSVHLGFSAADNFAGQPVAAGRIKPKTRALARRGIRAKKNDCLIRWFAVRCPIVGSFVDDEILAVQHPTGANVVRGRLSAQRLGERPIANEMIQQFFAVAESGSAGYAVNGFCANRQTSINRKDGFQMTRLPPTVSVSSMTPFERYGLNRLRFSVVNRFIFSALMTVALIYSSERSAQAQDNVRGGSEPIISSIDPTKLTYDYLVDGNLPQDDPAAKKFKTLQAAYAVAPAGVEAKPTVIGIAPNVYQISGSSARGASLSITKDYITLLGLSNNRRAVVLADNRGLMQGASDDGYIIDVNATGFTAKNLSIINYCNEDYEYPGDPSKNLHKRSDVITQGVALQAAGDKHIYENVALLGRLDTMFLRTTRSYFTNVYIEGTDDWMGGGQISVWEDCTLVYPTGGGVMSASGVVFRNCRFEAERGMEFYKTEFGGAARPDVLINCAMPVTSTQTPVAWVRGMAKSRPSYLSLTYHNKDASGNPAVFYDSNVGAPASTYSREMSDQEVLAFNSWNLLRAPPSGPSDDWDPAGVRDKYESAGQGSLPFRIALQGGSSSLRATRPQSGPAVSLEFQVRTAGPGVTIGATVVPSRVAAPINWSTKSDLVSLSRTTGPKVVVTGQNATSSAEWVAVNAATTNGLYATAYVYVEPKYLDPPTVGAGPVLNPPTGGMATVDYTLDLGGKEDQSLISWYVCDDATGANARKVAVSRGRQPLKALPLTPGCVGKYLKVTIQPKHQISDPGPMIQAISLNPVVAVDVLSSTVSPNFRNFVTETNATYASGIWTVLGAWSVVPGDDVGIGGASDTPMLVPRERLANGYGIRPSAPGQLLYQQDADCGDMQVDVVMAPEKQGTVFSVPGSPADSGVNNLHSDVFIKYDRRASNGYSLRFWRTTRSDKKCMCQLYKLENGAGSPLNDQQVLTGVFKGSVHITLKVTGAKLAVSAFNDVDKETLGLEGTITPNRFGGAGVSYPRGSSVIYSRLEISYPGAAVAK